MSVLCSIISCSCNLLSMRGLTSDVQAEEEEERGLLLQKKVTGETLLQLKRVRVLSFPPPPPSPSSKNQGPAN